MYNIGCRHVVVVVRRQRWRRRSSGPATGPCQPWLAAFWGGRGGLVVAGLAMSCRLISLWNLVEEKVLRTILTCASESQTGASWLAREWNQWTPSSAADPALVNKVVSDLDTHCQPLASNFMCVHAPTRENTCMHTYLNTTNTGWGGVSVGGRRVRGEQPYNV